MRRKKKQAKSHENSERWLLTYSDLITLLMIFFVIMYAMSNIDKQKYQQISESLQQTLGSSNISGGNGGGNGGKGDSIENNDMSTGQSGEATEGDLEDLKEKVDKYIKDKGLEDDIVANRYEKGLVISFKDNILFDSGEANLKQDYMENIKKLGELLKSVDYYVRVEGHTDNVPVVHHQFESNWELSSARANEVLHFLIDNKFVPEDKISSSGYGEHRPIVKNDTEENRSKNRRVDILLIDKKYEIMN